VRLQEIHEALKRYEDVGGAKEFFARLGYETLDKPLPFGEADKLPEGAKKLFDSFYLVSDYREPQYQTPLFRIYHVELKTETLRRTDFRRILEPFYRHYPQGNCLFVFTLSQKPYREIAFVSPQRLLVRTRKDEEDRVTIRLRTLRVLREEPYRTDLEILSEIAEPPSEPHAIWQKHEAAFNIERVTERFFGEYRNALDAMIEMLQRCSKPEPDESQRRARRFAFSQLFLNRLMVCYFLARKGWMRDDKGQPLRRYFRWLWKRYRDERARNPQMELSFYDWLQILFGDAFNNQLGKVQSAPLPKDVCDSFLTMPYLNGGLFAELEPDTYGYRVPDKVFSDLLFGDDPDRDPRLLERYNFTVDESRPYDEEMAVDPEMLGKVYESLIAEEERGKAGIFYTPRLEVDLMCRLSIAEYLHRRWNFDRKRVLEFVFAPYNPETLQPFTDAEKKAMEKALRECKIVDPAVGSGSFLVGMLNVLCELLDALAESLERKKYERFKLKRELILNNLYGVDVKDWAVRACELRLFLSLLVELPDGAIQKAEQTAPILPNLDFKIRVGDSIVQEIPGLPYPLILRKFSGFLLPIQARLKQLVFEKRQLAETQQVQLASKEREIWKEEREIIAQLLESVAKRLSSAKKEELSLLLQIESQREKLLKGEPIPLFLWEVAFPEVFLEGNGNERGFDIVIMNPPYVRHEEIEPPTELSPQDYKDAIRRNIYELWDGTVEVPGRADLYVPFFFVGVSLLKPGGILCLITSNSWLDVDYGEAVQKFLLSKTLWVMTIDNLARRTFAQSDINTVITLAARPKECENVWDNEVRFVAFRVPFNDLSSELLAVAFEEIFEAKERRQAPEYRVTPMTQWELFLEGNKIGGKYLRAPDIFFTILEKGKGKLVRLGDIAEVRRGFTTGANEFFYLEPVGRTVKDVAEIREKNPMQPIRVRNGAGWSGEIEAAWLRPVIKSPREIKTLKVRLEDLRYLVFMTPEDVRDAIDRGLAPPLSRYPKAAAYIRWGEAKGYQNRPTCASRQWWWDLGIRSSPSVVWVKSVNDNHRQAYVPFVALVDQRLYELQPDEPTIIAALLNSMAFFLAKELTSRVNLGEGALDTAVYEANATVILSDDALSSTHRERLLSAFDRLSRQPVRSIFEELGFTLCKARQCKHPEHPYEYVKPENLTLQQVKQASPDRFELDSVVFDVLGLTSKERLQVYQAVAQLVKDRLLKAKSVR